MTWKLAPATHFPTCWPDSGADDYADDESDGDAAADGYDAPDNYDASGIPGTHAHETTLAAARHARVRNVHFATAVTLACRARSRPRLHGA